MIRSGSISEIDHRQGIWAYLDLGFSKKETCGLIVGDEAPHELSYSDAVASLSSLPGKGHNTVNLVVEAPLSVAFDSRGNPTGRACELHNGQARYWYVGAGAIVTLAAMYMIPALDLAFKGKELILYEGFVSFKARKSTHQGDAALLRDTVVHKERNSARFIDPSAFKQKPSDVIRGAFEVQGINSGVPPIIAVFG